MECIVRVHIKRVDGEIVRRHLERCEDLEQREQFTVALAHLLLRTRAQLLLDEAQQLLLVHARAVVDVSVHFTAVVEVPVRHRALDFVFRIRIQHIVQIKACFKKLSKASR